MSEIVTAEPSIQERESLRLVTHVMYALHTASWFSAGIFSVIAMIINYIKLRACQRKWLRKNSSGRSGRLM